MKNLAAALALFASVSSLACSSSHEPGAAPNDAGGTASDAFAPLPASPTTFSLLGTSVAPGTEAFKCTYVTMPSTPGFIIGGNHEYTPGSHHLLIYRTDLTSVPTGQGDPNVGDCYAATNDYMSHIAGVVYPAATPTGSLTMPEGVGLPYKANEVFLFQVHYLNAGATPLNPQVYVHLDTQTTPVQQNAGVLFFYDPFIYVPQGALATAQMRCPIPQNITMFTEGSHYHARGVNYQAYLDTASTPASAPFYTSNDWASPTIALQSMPIQAGSFIRFYCDYDNTQGTQDFIQGQSAETNEMCMFVGMYYPAMDTNDEQCDNGDMFGDGTVNCSDSLACLNDCPSETDLGPLGVNFNECTQKCFVQSCPGASAPLTTLLSCIQGPCAAACGGDAGTAGGDCDSCVVSTCATPYAACTNQTCGASSAADGG